MRFKTVTDLSTSYNPVPKNERKKNKKETRSTTILL